MPWAWAAERLTPNKNYWVVTVSAAGKPHALPVWGVWDDDDLRFMFSCSPSARKARNIRANPLVAFTVDSTVECISVEGTAAPITDPARIDTWIDRYVAKYSSEIPEGLGDFVRSARDVRGRAERRIRHHRTRGRVRDTRHSLALPLISGKVGFSAGRRPYGPILNSRFQFTPDHRGRVRCEHCRFRFRARREVGRGSDGELAPVLVLVFLAADCAGVDLGDGLGHRAGARRCRGRRPS